MQMKSKNSNSVVSIDRCVHQNALKPT